MLLRRTCRDKDLSRLCIHEGPELPEDIPAAKGYPHKPIYDMQDLNGTAWKLTPAAGEQISSQRSSEDVLLL